MEGCGISCHYLSLNSHKRLFATSQIPALNPHAFTIYRFIVTLYFTAFNVWYMIYSLADYGWTFFIYLTNWTFIAIACYLLVASCNTLSYYLKVTHQNEEESFLVLSSVDAIELPFKYKLQWCLYNVIANVSMIITVVYWAVLYGLKANETGSLFVELNVHTLTSLFAIVETLLSATPVRFIHLAYPLLYGTIYLFFTIIYWAVGGNDVLNNPYIYPLLNYENEPVTAVLSILVCIVGVFVSQFILWMLYNLRLYLTNKFC